MTKRELLEELLQMILDAAVEEGVGEALDDEVHDAKSAEASVINNGGIRAQLSYLIGEAEVTDAFAKNWKKSVEELIEEAKN
jgi:hypothetical protein